MLKSSIVIGLFGLAMFSVACGGGVSSEGSTTTGSTRLALDVRCAVDSDCPPSFECEVTVEHGISNSFCKAHVEDGVASPTTCPGGFELEADDSSGPLCKPHDSADDSATHAPGTDDRANDAPGTDDRANAAPSTSASSEDAGVGCENEPELDRTSQCKSLGGK